MSNNDLFDINNKDLDTYMIVPMYITFDLAAILDDFLWVPILNYLECHILSLFQLPCFYH